MARDFSSLPCLWMPWAYRRSSFRSASQSDLPTKAFFAGSISLKMSTLWNECPIKKGHPTEVSDKVITVCLSSPLWAAGSQQNQMPHSQLSAPAKSPHKPSPVWPFNCCYCLHPHTNSPFRGLFYIFLVGPSGFNSYLLWSLQPTVVRLSFLNEILFLACCSAQEGRLIYTHRIKSIYPSRYSIHTHFDLSISPPSSNPEARWSPNYITKTSFS